MARGSKYWVAGWLEEFKLRLTQFNFNFNCLLELSLAKFDSSANLNQHWKVLFLSDHTELSIVKAVPEMFNFGMVHLSALDILFSVT